jgi:molybdopterin-guanine dinucleotide biosynthesis protein
MLAVEKVLSSRDYTLILGMPGTGKTTVVAHLIRMLVEMGKTVLLSAYTHSAVDTILAKLDDVDFSILRLGNIDKAGFAFLSNNADLSMAIADTRWVKTTPPLCSQAGHHD